MFHTDLTAKACSDKAHLKSLSGTVSSPNYPKTYPSNSSCTWFIEGKVGQIIRVQFDSFDVLSSPRCGLTSCKCDHVHLREPGSVNPARIKGKYCNTVKPVGSFTTVGHRLRVVFYSDSTGEGTGFSMNYEILDSTSNTTAMLPPTIASRSKITASPQIMITTTTTIMSKNKSGVVLSVLPGPTTEAILADTEGSILNPNVVASFAAKRMDRIQISSLDEPASRAKNDKSNGTAAGGSGDKTEEDPPDIVILGPSVISVLVFVGGVLGIAYHNYRENQREKNRCV